ncbi:anti-sigma regulatory factor (Ser/Thr protein kinase) [Catenulispora sp. GAS73]|uniref:ATP-binding protein n=1 Tax=Catenulispora sp. GAS73 TaxID=3156269 RepID=UPI0035168398
MTFDGLPERLSDVRQYLHRVLGDVDGVDDVVLVASELAGNAIRHSASGKPGGSFVLQVAEFTDAWHVRVDDQGSLGSPSPKDTEEADEAGRGLPVVAALTRAWGVIGDSKGRTVWAEIPYPKDDIEAEFYEGDAVRVREELALSIVVQPPHQAASCLPDAVPELHIFCVPVALVRTLTPDEPEGVLHWVEASALRVVTDKCPA